MLNEAFKHTKNWRNATVCDLESDALLEDVTKIHILGYQMQGESKPSYLWGDAERGRIEKFFQYHQDKEIPVVFHNGIGFDKRVVEKVYGLDLSKVMFIDTLWLSYYLNIDKKKHSIKALSKDYPQSAEKFEVDEGDWANLSREQAISRVVSDVELGKAVWEDFKKRLIDTHTTAKELIDCKLVGGKRVSEDEVLWVDGVSQLSLDEYIGRTIGYICSVSEVVAIQEDTGWEVDLPFLQEHLQELEVIAEQSKEKLEAVMPKIPDYRVRKQPAKPFKKNGDLSASGEKWETLKKLLVSELKDEDGNLLARVRKQGEIEELVGYNPPNINSSDQVKNFLFSKGWKPATYKFVRDQDEFTAWINSRPQEGSHQREWAVWKDNRPEDRAIPQIKKDGELCPSIEDLAELVPEVSVLNEYSVVVHRIGALKGIQGSMDKCGKVKAGAHGLASTLRLQHRKPIVNLPAAKKLYAEGIRGSLVGGKGRVLLGSDLSSLM